MDGSADDERRSRMSEDLQDERDRAIQLLRQVRDAATNWAVGYPQMRLDEIADLIDQSRLLAAETRKVAASAWQKLDATPGPWSHPDGLLDT
jgi:hypothetical protein